MPKRARLDFQLRPNRHYVVEASNMLATLDKDLIVFLTNSGYALALSYEAKECLGWSIQTLKLSSIH